MQRVNLSAVNKKALESLALSGGFDNFGVARECYSSTNGKGATFLDTLVRYGQLYQAEQTQAQHSLFGASEAVEIATPAIPQVDEWSTIERLNRERDLVGIYLSAHPLDDFKIILNSMCNTRCTELDDKVALTKKNELLIGGIVTGIKSKFTKTGKPCGFVTIEDFEGSGELAFFGEEWGRWRGHLTEGCSVLITAKCTQKYPDSTYYDLQISSIEYLQTVYDKRIERFTIFVDSNHIDETVVNDITTIVNSAPGNTRLYFNIRDIETNKSILLQSTRGTFTIKRDLVNYIESNPDMAYRVN